MYIEWGAGDVIYSQFLVGGYVAGLSLHYWQIPVCGGEMLEDGWGDTGVMQIGGGHLTGRQDCGY